MKEVQKADYANKATTTVAASSRHRLRMSARWLALALVTLCALASWFPIGSLSPFLAISSGLAVRAIGFLTLLGLPVLALAIWSRRWFCRWACPVGLLQDTVRKLSPVQNIGAARFGRWPQLGRWFSLLTLGGACAGYPLFLWMDPLAIFTGFLSGWRVPLTMATAIGALALPTVLLLELLMPKLWCHRLCPLGAMQEMLSWHTWGFGGSGHFQAAATDKDPLRRLGSRRSQWGSAAQVARRGFIAALAGVAGGLLARQSRAQMPPLRPPGAGPEDEFTGLCTRCGNCTRVCPTRILQPDLGEHGLIGLLTPVMRFDNGYCKEDCHRCNLACPSGAIARLALDEKKRRIIGVPVIDLNTCWLADGRECTACIRGCPFEAISIQSADGGFSTEPRVDLDKCNGCGACEVACPVRPIRSIRVVGVTAWRGRQQLPSAGATPTAQHN